jgi:hypothetical protein
MERCLQKRYVELQHFRRYDNVVNDNHEAIGQEVVREGDDVAPAQNQLSVGFLLRRPWGGTKPLTMSS